VATTRPTFLVRSSNVSICGRRFGHIPASYGFGEILGTFPGAGYTLLGKNTLVDSSVSVHNRKAFLVTHVVFGIKSTVVHPNRYYFLRFLYQFFFILREMAAPWERWPARRWCSFLPR
jgi:hypothetical protein